jgi:hypothetical protein
LAAETNDLRGLLGRGLLGRGLLWLGLAKFEIWGAKASIRDLQPQWLNPESRGCGGAAPSTDVPGKPVLTRNVSDLLFPFSE